MQDKRNFPDISEKGVYCLIFRNRNCILDAGSLKKIGFSKGYYIYVGSALGSGGLKRLKRHVLLSLDKNKKTTLACGLSFGFTGI
jgi:Uri superfamily endonuclease